MMPNKYLKFLPLFVVLRAILCLVLVRNYDHPDEYWQGPEIAHKIYYGYGYETWEWTAQKPIRSHLFPLIMSSVYKVLDILHISTPDLIAIAPRLYQILISSLFDYFLVLLAAQYESNSAWKITLLNYTSWASLTFMSRTFINSTETTLTLIAFYLWMRRNEHENGRRWDFISRVIVVGCYAMRHTIVLFWAVVWPYELVTMRGGWRQRVGFVLKNILTVGAMLGASVGFAYWWHGSVQFIEWNFYYFNIHLNWAILYGKYPVFSYFYLFLPFFLFGHLIYAYKATKSLYGESDLSPSEQLKENTNPTTVKYKQAFILSILILLVLSTSSHKQTRFLLILLPLLLIVCLRGYDLTPRPLKILAALLNLCLFLGINVMGRTAPYQALAHLRNNQPNLHSLMFLTQCHSTPFYSVLHHNIPTRFPTCSPVQRVENRDENTRLWRDPAVLFREMLRDFKQFPSHLLVQTKFEEKFEIDTDLYEKVREWEYSGVVDRVLFGRDGLAVWRRRRGSKHSSRM